MKKESISRRPDGEIEAARKAGCSEELEDVAMRVSRSEEGSIKDLVYQPFNLFPHKGWKPLVETVQDRRIVKGGIVPEVRHRALLADHVPPAMAPFFMKEHAEWLLWFFDIPRSLWSPTFPKSRFSCQRPGQDDTEAFE